MFLRMHISVYPSTTTKCQSLKWDVKPRCMRKPTNMVHGHIIRLMVGISSHCQNFIAHTIVTPSTPKANNYPIKSNFNTNASPIPLSHMPTRWCTHWLNAPKPSKEWQAKPGPLKLHRTYNILLTQHRLMYRQTLTNLKKLLPWTIFTTHNKFWGWRHPPAFPYPIPMTTDESYAPCSCRQKFQGCPQIFLQSNPSTCPFFHPPLNLAANPPHWLLSCPKHECHSKRWATRLHNAVWLEPHHCTLDVCTMNEVRKYRLCVWDGQLTCILPLRHNNEYFLKNKKYNFRDAMDGLKYGGRQLKNIWRWVWWSWLNRHCSYKTQDIKKNEKHSYPYVWIRESKIFTCLWRVF